MVQKTAKFATVPEDDKHSSFSDLDEYEEDLENSEIVVENNAETEGTTV